MYYYPQFSNFFSLCSQQEKDYCWLRVKNIRPVYISDPCRGHRGYSREKVFGYSKKKKKSLLIEDEGEREV